MNSNKIGTSEDPMTAEYFRIWSQKKAIKDKALEYINQFSSSRIDNPESFKELAITLCAVEKLLDDDIAAAEAKNKSNSSANSMKRAWIKWTIDRKYKFETVKLTQADYNDFSGAVKVFVLVLIYLFCLMEI